MKSILLTDGEFTGMIRALRALPFPVRITGFVSSENAAHTALLDAAYVPPRGTGDDYFDFLTDVIKREKVDAVFPIVTLDLEYMAQKAQEIFDLTGAKVITPSFEAIRVLNNKFLLYEALKDDAVLKDAVPFYLVAGTFGELRGAVADFSAKNVSCVVKPVRGENAEGFLKLTDRKEYEERVLKGTAGHTAALSIFDSHPDDECFNVERLMMPYLPGREYDVDVAAKDGKLLAITMRENTEMYGGLSACTTTCHNEKLLSYAQRIVETFNLSGLSCISFKEDESGNIKLLEVNPRAMGSINMSAMCGNNLLNYILDEKAEIPESPVVTRAGVTASLYSDLIIVKDECVDDVKAGDDLTEWHRFEEIDVGYYDKFYSAVRTRMTDLTYSCRYAWNSVYDIRWAVMEGCLVMISEGSGQSDAFMLTPLGDFDEDALRRIIDRVRPVFERKGLPFRILCIDESQLHIYEELGIPGAGISFNDDFSDYLYDAEDLRTLKGRKYSGKRNHLSHFLKDHPDYEYRALAPDYFSDCLSLTREWAASRGSDLDDPDESDYRMIEAVFNNWGRIKCRGGVIKIDGKVKAFSIGSVHGDTAYIHFEKADAAYDGLYVAINRLTVENEFPKVSFVNREEDLGIEGLRKAKESYYPCGRIRKYKMNFEGEVEFT